MEKQLETVLLHLIENYMASAAEEVLEDEDEVEAFSYPTAVRSFESAAVLTNNKGVCFELNGVKVQLTIAAE